VPGLAELLVLMHGARNRFRSVRAEVVERTHEDRNRLVFERGYAERPGTSVTSFGFGSADEPPPEWSEVVTRLHWAKPDRLRLDREDAVEVLVGERWWSVSETFGSVAGDPSSGIQMGIANPPFAALLDPAAVLLPDLDLEVEEEARLLNRPVLAARGLPRDERDEWAESHLVRGADEHRLWVDRDRGVVLRLASLVDGQPFRVIEIRAIAFDEVFPDETWILEPPPGESFGPIDPRHPFQVTLDEAQRRSPFTVLVPRRTPAGASVEVAFAPASARPPQPAFVSLSYRLDEHALDVHISQTGVGAADWDDVTEGGETVERDGRAVRIPKLGGQLQAVVDHLGTRALLLSESASRDLLVEMALSLEPAQGDPPALTG
jgi:hypothetical protein